MNTSPWWRRAATLIGALALVLGNAAMCFAQLDCWVPTRELSSSVNFRSPQVALLRAALERGEALTRANTQFKAMPRKIRIRSSVSIGDVVGIGGSVVRQGQLTTVAYRPEGWSATACDVIADADRCCQDGVVTITMNSPRALLRAAGSDEVLEMFLEPRVTATFGRYNEYDDRHVLIAPGGRVPWMPLTVADYLAFLERRIGRDRTEFERDMAKPPAIDEAQIRAGYEAMKKADPQAAEEYLADMQKLREELPKQRASQEASGRASLAKRLADLQAYRASLTPAGLAAQAREGAGPMGLAPAGESNTQPLVKLDPGFGWDARNANRIQLIGVTNSYLATDDVVERREALRKTKETFDYAGLAALLQ